MLKFGIRQAGVVDGGQKTRNPLPNPTSRPKKRLKAPEIPPRPPKAPGGTPQAPGDSRRSQRRPKTQNTPTFPGGGLEIWDPPGRGCGRKPKNPKPTTKPNVQTQKKGSNPGPQRRPRHHRHPQKPRSPRRPPGRFRSSKGHNRKSPQPFRKIPKGYRSARDKTLDQSQADKGGSGNLGRQPETRKGIKLGGCLRKQGVGERNQHTSSWFVAHERCAVA